jgi:lipid-binding SYLF domain-containing protein
MKKLILTAMIAALAPACAHEQKTANQAATLESKAATTLTEMRQRDPTVDAVLQNAYAYAVLPDVGKAGFIAGGASGEGILYEQGRPTGTVKLTQASVGAQAGAQTFAQLVILHNADEVTKLKAGSLDLGATMSAVVLKAGGGAASDMARGASVFIMPRGGAMVEASIAGQQLSYQPFAA